MRDGTQEIQRRVRHVRERGYPAACKQSETRGGEFGRFGYAERDHGVSLTLEGNDNSPLSLGENVASDVTPTGDNDAVTVIWLIPNEGGWRGWRVGLGVGVEVFT